MRHALFDEPLALDDEARSLVQRHGGVAGQAPQDAATVRGHVIDHRDQDFGGQPTTASLGFGRHLAQMPARGSGQPRARLEEHEARTQHRSVLRKDTEMNHAVEVITGQRIVR